MTYGENILMARKNAEMSRAELSRLSGVGTMLLYAYEIRGTTPRIREAIRIAEALRISVDELFGRPHDKHYEILSPTEWRKKRGMSREKLAERAGVEWKTVMNLERGARNTSLPTVEACADVLGLGIDEYLGVLKYADNA